MKIALVGYGVMGQAVERLAPELSAEVVAVIDSRDPPVDSAVLGGAEVAIEFAGPAGAPARITQLARVGVPVVSGSTGWDARFAEVSGEVRRAEGALLHAPNLSLGVALFTEIVREASRLLNILPEYRIELEETHHTRKVDHPSGTARWLSEQVVERVERLDRWAEVGDGAEAPLDRTLPVRAFRESDVPGTHLLRATGPVDRIELRHEALSRDGFARGALEVAAWLRGRSGIFTLDDYLQDRLTR